MQSELFPNKKKALLSGQELSFNSKFAMLAPFIDFEGVLRAKRRLGRAKMDFVSKHHIVLISHHRVVELYLNHEHQLCHHQGVEYLRRMIQRRFWIIGLRNALRSVTHNSVTCRRNASAILPQMSDLPQSRVEARVRPFANCGVDNNGPLEVEFFRRTIKCGYAYSLVLVCELSTWKLLIA